MLVILTVIRGWTIFFYKQKLKMHTHKKLVLIPIISVHTMIDFHDLTQVPSMEGANNIS
jgi:hypothetical protein